MIWLLICGAHVFSVTMLCVCQTETNAYFMCEGYTQSRQNNYMYLFRVVTSQCLVGFKLSQCYNRYCLLADYESYIKCQERVSEVYKDRAKWLKMTIKNIATVGKFSSDRTIQEYAKDIWGAVPCPVPPEPVKTTAGKSSKS